jgi:hypothetical protein
MEHFAATRSSRGSICLEGRNCLLPGSDPCTVFCGLDRRELGNRALPPHVRGVLLKREFAPTLELALGPAFGRRAT